jgi:C-terminal processing protease CtpA/Prc
MRAPTLSTLTRWRTARRAVLGAIVLAGAVATSTAVVRQVALSECSSHRVDRAYTYGGIGIVIERSDEGVVVKRVMPGTPADGRLHAGARLVSVDGEMPADIETWASAIRGAPGTTVELEVEYPCGGSKTLAIGRDVIRMEY